MSQYGWPHPAYAEDQPYAKSLLYVHVFHRGYEVGAGVGVLTALYNMRRVSRQRAVASALATTTTTTATSLLKTLPSNRQIFWGNIATSSLIGGGLTMLLLTGRMWGLQDIEWQDRSWRLLENKGQAMHDKYSDWGAGIGALTTVFAARGAEGVKRSIAWEIAGRAGLGALVGMVTCEVVRNIWKEGDETKK